MTMMSDLSKDLVEEILSKAPITSLGAVRSTRKQWNASSKDRLLCKAEPREQFLRFMVMDHRFLSMTFNLHGILKGDGEVFVRPSIKEVGDIVNQIDISKVFHCDGLVLCVTNDNSSLVVWNPYLGQTKWIETREPHDESDMFALGYDKDKNHKILRDEAGSFFIDEEKKLAVVFNLDRKSDKRTKKKRCYHTAYIVGVKGYLRKVVLGEAVEVREGVYRSALVCSSSYVPSLEKINQIEEEEEEEDMCKSTKMVDAKGKDKKRKRKSKT
ncbi:unnamed protein product [Arabidopsis lyrata]|nr:unnamed protein product [Arabidopsis lyrata]